MESAHHTPKDEAGAPGKGAAIVTRPAKAGKPAAAELVVVDQGKPVTDTERVAQAAGVQHKNVLALVREHLADFQEFGRVAFETRPFATAGGDQSREISILNEPQSALLFTFLRNTLAVRAVKVRLVREFFRISAELARVQAEQARAAAPVLPQDYIGALRALADSLDGRQRVEQTLAVVERQVAAQQPAVVAQARLAGAGGELCLTDAAKSLQMRRIDLTAWMSSHGWIYRRDSRDGRAGPWRAMQTQIAAGRLAHRHVAYPGRDGSEREADQVVVTPKGLAKLAELLAGNPR